MSTEKEPDYKGIARKLADQHYVLDDAISQAIKGRSIDVAVPALKAKGYASCMEARLRSDWETIKMLRWARHDAACAFAFHEAHRAKESAKDAEARIALIDERISKLLEPFT